MIRDQTIAAYELVTNANIITIVRVMAPVIARLKYHVIVTISVPCNNSAVIQVIIRYKIYILYIPHRICEIKEMGSFFFDQRSCVTLFWLSCPSVVDQKYNKNNTPIISVIWCWNALFTKPHSHKAIELSNGIQRNTNIAHTNNHTMCFFLRWNVIISFHIWNMSIIIIIKTIVQMDLQMYQNLGITLKILFRWYNY